MKDLILYGREDCPMCIEARRWLQEKEISFIFREIFKQPLNKNELLSLAKKLPKGLFNLYAPKGARKAGLSEDPGTFSIQEILQLQIDNPDMIRYPVFDLRDRLIFGFHESTKDLLLDGLRGPAR
ncbi:MAG: glutaredoxin domain-containing protein [Nitrospiria bacterium]